jgi:hypothetical protein
MAFHCTVLSVKINLNDTWFIRPPVSVVSMSITILFLIAHLLGLTNINDVSVCISRHPVVNPDSYHPSLMLDSKLTSEYTHISRTPHRNYVQGDHFLLYSTLLASACSSVLNENSVDSAVHLLTSALTEAMSLAIPFVKYRHSFFSHCSFSSLKYYIKKKTRFSRRH